MVCHYALCIDDCYALWLVTAVKQQAVRSQSRPRLRLHPAIRPSRYDRLSLRGRTGARLGGARCYRRRSDKISRWRLLRSDDYATTRCAGQAIGVGNTHTHTQKEGKRGNGQLAAPKNQNKSCYYICGHCRRSGPKDTQLWTGTVVARYYSNGRQTTVCCMTSIE